jgi:hypothetical protein
MGGLVGDEDARRPEIFPRLSERYRVDVDAAWHAPSRRRLVNGKPVRIEAEVLDLSIAGALLKAQANEKIQIGRRLKFELNGLDCIVEVRNVRPSSSERSCYYGVSFFRLTDEMRAELFSIVGRIRSGDLEDIWIRSDWRSTLMVEWPPMGVFTEVAGRLVSYHWFHDRWKVCWMNRTIGAVGLLSLFLGFTVAFRTETGRAETPGLFGLGASQDDGRSVTEIEVTARALAATVRIAARNCEGLMIGSGFVVDGVLLTNRHLVTDARLAKIDRPVAPVLVEIARRSTKLDLAALAPVNALALDFADGDASLGDTVYLAGHGDGQETRVMKATVHLFTDGSSYGLDGPLLVLDGPSSVGFSGGPVLDEEGRVVGILQGYEPNLRLSLAIPVSAIRNWLDVTSMASSPSILCQ